MAEIKYTGAPTVTPEEARRTAAIPSYQLSFPNVQMTRAGAVAGEELGRATGQLGATMHTLGASIDTLGRTMTGAGDEMFQRAIGLKQLETETQVNNATIAWEQGQIKRDEEFKKKEGAQANSGALEAHLKSSEDDRQKVRTALGSPQAQKLFDQQTTRVYLQFARSAASHSNTETKKEAQNAIEARLSLIGNSIIASKEDADRDAAVKEGAKVIMNERRFAHGDSLETAGIYAQTWINKHLLGNAERMSSDGDSSNALKFLDDNRERIEKTDAKGFMEVRKKIEAERDSNFSRAIADGAAQPGANENPAGARQKMLDEVDRAAKAGNWTDDQKIKVTQQANERFNARIATMDHDHVVDHRNAHNETTKALYGKQPGQEKPPETPEELWAAVKKEDKAKLTEEERHQFEVHALNNVYEVPPTPANQAEYHKWRGLLIRDPQQVLEQEDKTPGFIERLSMPRHQKEALTDGLFKAQRDGMKAAAELRVGQLWRYGRDHSLITEREAEPNNDEGHMLHSYLADSLNAWVQNHKGKLPTGDDYKAIINDAKFKMQEEVPRMGIPLPWRWWQVTRERAVYQQAQDEQNPKFKEYKEWYQKTYKPGASDEEAKNAWLTDYARKRLQEQEGKKIRARSTPTVQPGG